MRRSAGGKLALAAVGLAAAGLAGLLPSSGWADPGLEDPPEAAKILRRAFHQRYEIDVSSEIELQIEVNGDEVRRRVFLTAMSGSGDEFRAIGQLVSPPYLQGMTILSLEEDGSHQTFAYLPSMGRVRRISTAQDGDAFLGSDLRYEDFTRRRVSDCAEVALEPEALVGEERAYVVACRARHAKSYDRAVFVVAQSDAAILKISYYGNDGDGLVRSVSLPREHIESIDGHPLPTRMRFETPSRGTATDVIVRNLQTASFSESLFSPSFLRQKPDLRRLIR